MLLKLNLVWEVILEFGIKTINVKATFLSFINTSWHKFFCRDKYLHSSFFALQPQFTQSSKHMFVDMSFNNISLQATRDFHKQHLAKKKSATKSDMLNCHPGKHLIFTASLSKSTPPLPDLPMQDRLQSLHDERIWRQGIV